jgi:hypothetical protein
LLGRFGAAEAAYARAVSIMRKSGTDPIIVGWALTGLGRARVGEGRSEAALAPLEEAFAIREQRKAPAAQLGETRFDLARALWARPAERSRALALAASARVDLSGDARTLAEVDAWLAHKSP